jgi:hypothetical protein
LEATNSVDAEMKSLLKVLDSDIRHLLSKKDEETPDANDLATRAQSLSAKFATEHPQLEQVMRELADSLARMGI